MLITLKQSIDFTMAENTRIHRSNQAKIARRLVCKEEKKFAEQAALGLLLMWNPDSTQTAGLPLEICLLIVSFIQPSRLEAVQISKVCKKAFLFGHIARNEYIEKHGKSYEELDPYVIYPMASLLL